MKKFICLAVIVGLTSMMMQMVSAGQRIEGYTLTASTYAHAGTIAIGSLPTTAKISSTTIRTGEITDLDISLSNVNAEFAPQIITLYDEIVTTGTMTAIWKVTIASGSANGIYSKHFDPPLSADNGLYLESSQTTTAVYGSIGVR